MFGSFPVCVDESLLKGKVVEEYIFVRNCAFTDLDYYKEISFTYNVSVF